MKLNKTYSFIKNIINSDNSRTQLTAIYIIAVSLTIFVMWGTSDTINTDSASYLDAGSTFLNGNLDFFRTPLYPLVCSLAQAITDSPLKYSIIVWLQQIIFLFSIFAFYNMARRFIHSSKTNFFCTLFYACHPGIILWNQSVLSESFAISGMVFFAYSVTLFINKPTHKHAILTNLILFLILMLRPGFVYLIPVTMLLWGYLFFKKRSRPTISGTLGVLLVTASFLGYCYKFQKEHELFSPSVVSLYNQYYMLREANLIKIDEINTGNDSLRQDLMKTLPLTDISPYDDEFLPLAQKYGNPALDNIVRNAIKLHSQEYLNLTLKRFHYVNSLKFFTTYAVINSGLVKAYAFGTLFVFNATFRIIYFLLFGYGICLIYYSLKRKQIPILSCFMWIVTSCHVFSIIAGAQAEWARLTVPCIPILIIMAGQSIDQFHIRRKNHIILP